GVPPNGVVQLNAYGFLRGILITCTFTGGAGGSAVVAADGPWNVLRDIMLQEPSGATIQQFNTGYQAFLYSKYYGIARNADPRAGAYTALDANGNGRFQIYLPLELDPRSGLGSLPNQNSAAEFQLRYTVAP